MTESLKRKETQVVLVPFNKFKGETGSVQATFVAKAGLAFDIAHSVDMPACCCRSIRQQDIGKGRKVHVRLDSHTDNRLQG